MSDIFKPIIKMVNEIDEVLSKYGFQVDTVSGCFLHPINIAITIEEKDNDVQ